jgi:hypothetical protein
MKLKDLLINLLLTLSSIYIPLVLFSVYDNFSRHSLPHRRLERARYRKDISRKIAAVNSGISPIYYPSSVLGNAKEPKIYPIGTLPLRDTYYCNEGYGLITFKSDRFGLRNSDKKWDLVKNKSNIFIIGDSFVHGACVPDDSTISSNVERLTEINTMNFGMGDSDPYEYMVKQVSLVKPILDVTKKNNIVVMIFCVNDNKPYNPKKEKLLNSQESIMQISSKDEIYPTEFYNDNHEKLVKSSFPVSSKGIIIRKIKSKLFKNKILTLYPVREKIEQIYFQNLKPRSNIKINSLSVSERSISLLSQICKENCEPYVGFIPSSNFWNPGKSFAEKEYKKELKRMSERVGITFIDSEEVISKDNLKDYAPEGGHLSLEGYKKVADLISKKVLN